MGHPCSGVLWKIKASAAWDCDDVFAPVGQAVYEVLGDLNRRKMNFRCICTSFRYSTVERRDARSKFNTSWKTRRQMRQIKTGEEYMIWGLEDPRLRMLRWNGGSMHNSSSRKVNGSARSHAALQVAGLEKGVGLGERKRLRHF